MRQISDHIRHNVSLGLLLINFWIICRLQGTNKVSWSACTRYDVCGGIASKIICWSCGHLTSHDWLSSINKPGSSFELSTQCQSTETIHRISSRLYIRNLSSDKQLVKVRNFSGDPHFVLGIDKHWRNVYSSIKCTKWADDSRTLLPTSYFSNFFCHICLACNIIVKNIWKWKFVLVPYIIQVCKNYSKSRCRICAG